MKLTVTVPDLGGFKDVAVIDVLVKPGQAVEVEIEGVGELTNRLETAD